MSVKTSKPTVRLQQVQAAVLARIAAKQSTIKGKNVSIAQLIWSKDK